MKKKMIGLMLGMVLALSITACGGADTTQGSATTNSEQQTQEQGAKSGKNSEAVKESDSGETEATKEAEKETIKEKEEPTETTEVEEKDELPNWKGVYDNVGATILHQGTFGIVIEYPSLKPASSGCAYQMDPALVLVCTPHKNENGEYVVIENVEDTLSASHRTISMWLEDYRGYGYTDFNFLVENQELLTINDFPACKYTGIHTYVVDDTTYEIPFAAYSFYTGQLEGYSYFTAIVMDDSLNNPSMEPLAEGTIEAYAKKMVESVELR